MRPDPFQTTQWSLVTTARDRSSLAAREAFDGLAQQYWHPLYTYVLRRGHSPEESEDLVQSFFVRFIEQDYLQTVSAEKGRFRAFLLACLKHFLADEYDKQQAQKRGGGMLALSIHAGDVAEYAAAGSADAAYNRAWAIAVLDESITRVESEYNGQQKAALFKRLRPRLEGVEELPYRELAAELDLSETALRKAAQRLRRRYKEIVREVIRDSLAPGENVEVELRDLFDALR